MDPNSGANGTDTTPNADANQTDGGNQDGAANEGQRTDTTQAQDTSWHKQLRLDLRGHEALNGLGSPSELAEKYISLSKNAVVRPGADATDEDRAAYYAAVGVPESAEGYQLAPKEGVINQEHVDAFAERALRAKLTPEQTNELYQANLEAREELLKQQTQQAEAAEARLKKEWGDSYDANVERVVATIRKLGGDELAKQVATLPGNMSEGMLKAFYAIAEQIDDDSIPGGDPTNAGGRDQGRSESGLPKITFRGPRK